MQLFHSIFKTSIPSKRKWAWVQSETIYGIQGRINPLGGSRHILVWGPPFLGGILPEGDGDGLSLWALGQFLQPTLTVQAK